MSEEKMKTLTFYCKFCETEREHDFLGEDRKKVFTLTFHCPECGSYHVFEFFGSQFEQPTELD
jgi:ribosomal protein L44E